MIRFLRRIFAADRRPRRRRRSSWERIGDSQNTTKIPQWVLTRFANEGGSHGTRLIDYPDAGRRLIYEGRTYRYVINMGDQSWVVYRRLRKSAGRRSSRGFKG